MERIVIKGKPVATMPDGDRLFVAFNEFAAAVGFDDSGRRYLMDNTRAVSKTRGRVVVNNLTAYTVREISEAVALRRDKIAAKFGSNILADAEVALRLLQTDENKSEAAAVTVPAEIPPPTMTKDDSDEGDLLREALANLSNERAEGTRLAAALEEEEAAKDIAFAEMRKTEAALAAMTKKAEAAKAEAREAIDAKRRADLVYNRNEAGIAAELADLRSRLEEAKKTDRGVARLRAVFSSPFALFVPLAGIVFVSFIDMGTVFASSFASPVAAWAMSFVFASVVLVFTFNAKGRAGVGFAVAFAFIEALVNGVYFGFLPSAIIAPTATIALPTALLAYSHLFKNKTAENDI